MGSVWLELKGLLRKCRWLLVSPPSWLVATPQNTVSVSREILAVIIVSHVKLGPSQTPVQTTLRPMEKSVAILA